jgi:hypothetical protein
MMNRASSAARTAALSAVAAAAATFGVSAPAQAAYPAVNVNVPYGQSYVSGTVTFFNRSVEFDGKLAITSGNCRNATIISYAKTATRATVLGVSQTGNQCNYNLTTTIYQRDLTIPANVPGGANYVEVYIGESAANPYLAGKGYWKP